jgi:hypothetical protein
MPQVCFNGDVLVYFECNKEVEGHEEKKKLDSIGKVKGIENFAESY